MTDGDGVHVVDHSMIGLCQMQKNVVTLSGLRTLLRSRDGVSFPMALSWSAKEPIRGLPTEEQETLSKHCYCPPEL
ncbi:nuclear migration protein NudF [Aspergillus luchuensis]|uniref:Nuclear migration protein NudF n=1 Tax=Aspergillus kawachii TaxID=1069201 RepID=A0A146F1E3_ASPKA|nr:nuclear migration protein NudF [Aspergillus luchuensis]